MYYINTLKCELVNTNACNVQPSLSERVIVDGHGCHTALHFGVKAKVCFSMNHEFWYKYAFL